MRKKFQVFISSTYTDLIDERKAVEETIIRAGDIPVGMEAFPAADEEQFEFIKTIIDQCDYYILIIAGRYGSLAPDGMSYTEKEYHYAVEQCVPVLVMLHGDRGSLPVAKSESAATSRKLLDAFVSKVSEGRLRKVWTTVDGLKLAVREALDHAKATKERPGWIRGDQALSADSVGQIVSLQQENAELRSKLRASEAAIEVPENLAGLEHGITVDGKFKVPAEDGFGSRKCRFSIPTTYGEIFELLSPHLLISSGDDDVNEIIGRCLWQRQKWTSNQRE